MKIFNLPDLGEGLAEAEIREWYVSEGSEVKTEQPLVAVETAKALVDVPSPRSGKIEKLYGKPGEIIKTGHPLVAFVEDAETARDSGTVVGHVEVGHKVLNESATGINVATSSSARLKASPAVRALAKELNVDLANVPGTGPTGSITLADVKMMAATSSENRPVANAPGSEQRSLPDVLHGARRAMAIAMAIAHQEIVPVTLMDYANISHLDKKDLTLRVLRAMVTACQKEPALNAHFDGKSISRELFKEVNIGLAVDTKDALYVPVLKNIAAQSDEKLRAEINRYKEAAQKQAFSQEDLRGLTITLSNFGAVGGKYANPIVVPPTVAILGAGRASEEVIVVNGEAKVQRILPLSLTFDHRAVTGGEAARFLVVVIAELQK